MAALLSSSGISCPWPHSRQLVTSSCIQFEARLNAQNQGLGHGGDGGVVKVLTGEGETK